jgi:hypothetical protein
MKLLRRISDLEPDTHTWLTEPPGGNILQVNLKAKYSPYVVVDPRHVAIDCYAGEIIRERSMLIVIRDWGLSPARVEIDGQPVPAGKDLRLGSVHRLEGDDLVVWIRKDATAPLRITVAPAGPDAAR